MEMFKSAENLNWKFLSFFDGYYRLITIAYINILICFPILISCKKNSSNVFGGLGNIFNRLSMRSQTCLMGWSSGFLGGQTTSEIPTSWRYCCTILAMCVLTLSWMSLKFAPVNGANRRTCSSKTSIVVPVTLYVLEITPYGPLDALTPYYYYPATIPHRSHNVTLGVAFRRSFVHSILSDMRNMRISSFPIFIIPNNVFMKKCNFCGLCSKRNNGPVGVLPGRG